MTTHLLEQAVASDDADHAAKLIMDALGIVDGDVAAHTFPREWPASRSLRAEVLAEWLKTELRYIGED